MRAKIIDEFTDLPISKQRKHQLRNPQKHKEQRKRWAQSPDGKIKHALSSKKWYEAKHKSIKEQK